MQGLRSWLRYVLLSKKTKRHERPGATPPIIAATRMNAGMSMPFG